MEMRFLLLVLLVFLLVGQHAVLALVPVADCCESDEAASPVGCDASCPLCTCCMERSPVDLPTLGAPALSLAPEGVLAASLGLPPSPEPAEILHVPKSVPA